MEWRERDGVRWLEAELPGARAVFSTRTGGVSEPPYDSLNLAVRTGDSPGRVHDNRRALAAALGIAPENVVMGRQVHGAALVWHEAPQSPRVYADVVPSPIEADAHATDQPGLVPLVMTADCLPVALAGPGGIAMAHAGWRGLAGGVLAAAAARVGASAAAIGPGIGPCCYEVGDEVARPFAAAFGGDVLHGRRLDLWTAAERALNAAGVDEVLRTDLCTCCDPDRFFSHRRTGKPRGVQGVIARVA